MYLKKLVKTALSVVLLSLVSCSDVVPDKPIIEETPIDSIKHINVYIENSGSMDGYVNGNTEFKGAIRDLLVTLKYHYDSAVKVHFINSKIRETATESDLIDFSKNINTVWSVKGEDRKSSNLNNVFKMILDKTNNETISILFSDCIYSISGEDAEGLLPDEKSLTKDAFLSRWKVDSLKLSTAIVKMTSKFKGTYYDSKNKKTFLDNDYRPYYVLIIGNEKLLPNFNTNIQIEQGKVEGFQNKYVISTGSVSNIYYSILLSTDNIGRFKASRNCSSKVYVHGIEKIDMKSRKKEDNNKLTFAVAIDLKDVPVERDYLLNIDNYILSDNNFIIKEIKVAEKNTINASDWVKICDSNPTHLIVLQATGTAIGDIKVALTKQIPAWIDSLNIIDDKDIKSNLDKTFGFKYLVEGIAEAYQTIYPKDKNYFEFEIKMKK